MSATGHGGIDAEVARFCIESIDACAGDPSSHEDTIRRFGPLTVEVVPVGSLARGGLVDRLFRGTVGGEVAGAADFRLYVSAGSDGPLGTPPLTWPFEIVDRESFHRVHWSPPQGTALTSDEQCGVWNMMDRGGERGLFWIDDPDALPSWEYATPLRHHVHWQALRREAVVVHSAAIETGNGCFLLTGPGGSGKSTTTVAALEAGRRILAEDLSWVDLATGSVTAHPLYSSVKLTAEARARFPFIERFIANHDHTVYDKTLVYLDDQAGSLTAPATVRGLFCLSGKFDTETRIEPCGKLLAFKLLAPSTLFLMRTSTMETVARLRALIDRLPTFHVTLGADPVAAVETISAFAEKLP